jgi:ferrous iron transport protein B
LAESVKIALAGNPNSGKTTIFNALTGAHQHVGNYPGVTVEVKSGSLTRDTARITIVDLPGTYSLTALSEEELVARNFLIDEKPDVVIDVVDATSLERQLYLAIQLIELGAKLVLAFNMTDMARKAGFEFDLPLLSRLLGVPIVQTVGSRGEGLDGLLEVALSVARGETQTLLKPLSYGREIDTELAKIEAELLATDIDRSIGTPARWLAIKLLENDPGVLSLLEEKGILAGKITSLLELSNQRLRQVYSDSPDILIAEARYGIISGACSEAVRHTVETRHSFSDNLDTILLSPILGIPIFLLVMFTVFMLTFRLGDPLMRVLEIFFGFLGRSIAGFWPEGSTSPLQSLLVDGVIGGVGGVLVFLPNILLLFIGIALLEDSGYMARAAFIMDRVMHTIGLHGKSFIPMLIGFGCTVPAIMGTRILENRRDRLVSILVLPLFSCSARLPIYALIIPAFFPKNLQAPMLWLIYVIGILMAITLTRLLRGTLFRGESTPFVMELPPYRVPTFRGILIHAWDRGYQYFRKAGTIILMISIILWFASTYPALPQSRVESLRSAITNTSELNNQLAEEELTNSAVGRIAHWMTPVLKPMGFDWRIGSALIGAIAAKEVFVAQMGIVFSVGEAGEKSEPLRQKLQENYTPLVGFCIMLFCLIGLPCVATFAVTRSETGSWWWAILQHSGLTTLAWIVTTVVYQVGTFAGWGTR